MAHVRVLCVMDEGAKENTSLIGSRGASFLFDVDGKRIMFNAGKSGRYLTHNLSYLRIPADSIDAAVISYPSIEYIGGLNSLMTIRKKPLDVYAAPEAWSCKRLMGDLITEDNRGGVNDIDVGDEWIQLTEHLHLSPFADQESRELALVLKTNQGPVVFCVRAASGIASILEMAKRRFGQLRGLVGGIEMHKLKQPAVNEIAGSITGMYGIGEIYLNGITGREGIQKMRVATSNDKIKDFFGGYELDFTV